MWKRCKSPWPSNQWLKEVSPHSNLPGPFLTKVPVSQEGRLPFTSALIGSECSSAVWNRRVWSCSAVMIDSMYGKWKRILCSKCFVLHRRIAGIRSEAYLALTTTTSITPTKMQKATICCCFFLKHCHYIFVMPCRLLCVTSLRRYQATSHRQSHENN